MARPLYIEIIKYSISIDLIGSQNHLKCVSLMKSSADATRKGHVLPGHYDSVLRYERIGANNTFADVPHDALTHFYTELIGSRLQISLESEEQLIFINVSSTLRKYYVNYYVTRIPEIHSRHSLIDVRLSQFAYTTFAEENANETRIILLRPVLYRKYEGIRKMRRRVAEFQIAVNR